MGENQSVYSDKKILTLSIITVVFSLSGLVWYQNSMLRYIVIVITAVAALYLLKIAPKARKNK